MKQSILENNSIVHCKRNSYRILYPVGEGGCGSVYKARNTSTGQVVAIKTLKYQDFFSLYLRKQQICRFERELQISGRIIHPHIVRLLDKGYLENQEPFAVFEYIAGTTLKDFILKKGGLSPAETKELMYQTLDALHYIHTTGIIHCDLKPRNIMVTQKGWKPCIKMLDFGISTFAGNLKTISGMEAGTPGYSLPKQLQTERITEYTDLYAWAMTFIECLTGYPVIHNKTLETIDQQHLLAGVLNGRLRNPGIILEKYAEIDLNDLIVKRHTCNSCRHTLADDMTRFYT